jgi:hypothetical protein
MRSPIETGATGFSKQKLSRRALFKAGLALSAAHFSGSTYSEKALGIPPESRTRFPIGVAIHAGDESDDTTRTTHIELAGKSGFGIARTDFRLEHLLARKRSGGYEVSGVDLALKKLDYLRFDDIVGEAKKQNVEIIAILNTDLPDQDMTPDLYGEYAGKVAHHYKGEIPYYELGNEVNATMSPWEYVEFVKAASTAIRRVDSNAKIISSGLIAPVYPNLGLTYLQMMYLADPRLNQYIDMVGIHPYNWYSWIPWMPDGSEPNFGQINEFSRTMKKYGGSGSVGVTEIGWPTKPAKGGVTEEEQAAFTGEVLNFVLHTKSPVALVCIYDLMDDKRERNFSDPEANFGIFTESGRQKPAARLIVKEREIFNRSRICSTTVDN